MEVFFLLPFRFRTKFGIWDLVLNNTPVFFLRDPAKFPHFVHTQKRNPQTNLKDANAVWWAILVFSPPIYIVLYLIPDVTTGTTLDRTVKHFISSFVYSPMQVHQMVRILSSKEALRSIRLMSLNLSQDLSTWTPSLDIHTAGSRRMVRIDRLA